MLYYCFGIPGEGFSAPKVEVRLVKLDGMRTLHGADEDLFRSRKMLWPLRRAALIRVLGPIGDGANEVGRGRENKSRGGAESKGDNDMLQCVIIS